MKKILPLLIIFLLYAIPHQKSFAYVAGGVGTLTLSPITSSLELNQNSSVDIKMSTGNIAISTVALRLSFPVPSPTDLTVLSVIPNPSLASAGWFFQINSVSTQNGITTMDLAGLNTSFTGYATGTNVTLATISWKALAPFSGKAVTFDTSLTKMNGKVNPADILGTLGNGTYSTTTIPQSPTTTLTPTPTPTLTPTPTSAPTTNAIPICTGIGVSQSTVAGQGTTVTISCTGIDPNGYLSAGYFDFGDAKNTTVERNAGSPGTFSTTHTYSQIGTYAAICKVRDNDNIWSPSADACKRYITFRSADTGTTIVMTTPTPTVVRTVTSPTRSVPTPTFAAIAQITNTPAETITPIPTYTPPVAAAAQSPTWLLWGSAGLIGFGCIIYLLGKK